MFRAFWILVATFVIAGAVIGWVEMTRVPEIVDAGYIPPTEEEKEADTSTGPIFLEDERLMRAARCTVYDMTIAEGLENQWIADYNALGDGSLPVTEIESRAGNGDVTAMELLAFHLANRGGEDAMDAAGRWMVQAAEEGSVIASQEVGFARIQGTLGFDVDIDEGARWLSVAAQGGDPIATHNLADLYAAGTIDPPDGVASGDALEAYLDAAADCYADSLEEISDRLKRGHSLPRNLEIAGWIDRNVWIYRN